MKNNIAPGGSIYRAVLALALASSCAYAQSEQTSPVAAEEVELAPVTVSAHEGNAVPYDQTGVSVAVLDVKELKKEGIYSLSEALTTAPGAYVLPGGGKYQKGNASDLVIRGMSREKYVLPMLDGMRLGGGMSSGNGLVASNLVSRTPLFGLGTLELLRGAEGASYGSGAMSGVLYMETPEGEGEPSLSLFNEYGSFDSYTGNVTAQGRVNDSSFFVSTTYERTNNNVHFADGSTPDNRHEGKYQNWSEALRLDKRFGEKSQLTFTYRRDDAALRNEGARYEFQTNLTTLRLQTQLTEKYSASVMLGYYGNCAVYGAHNTYAWGMPISEQDLDNVQVEWRNAYKWSEQHKTTAGIAWSRTEFSNFAGGDKQGQYSSLDSVLGFFAEHTVEPVKNWKSSLALRWDQSNVYDGLFTLRAATNYKFNRERTRVFASAGRGYAAPSSFERSNSAFVTNAWGYPMSYYGNPNLKCETNWSVDFGAEQEVAKEQFVSATLFWIRTEDAITSAWDNDLLGYRFENADTHWTNQGVELALRGTFEKNWNTGYKVAFTYAQPKEKDDTQCPHSARQVWTADLHTSPVKGLTTGVGLAAAVGRCGWSGSRLDNYAVLRWYARYQINENLSVHLRVENLTNQKLELDEGYAGASDTWINPGAAVYAGCTVKF